MNDKTTYSRFWSDYFIKTSLWWQFTNMIAISRNQFIDFSGGVLPSPIDDRWPSCIIHKCQVSIAGFYCLYQHN